MGLSGTSCFGSPCSGPLTQHALLLRPKKAVLMHTRSPAGKVNTIVLIAHRVCQQAQLGGRLLYAGAVITGIEGSRAGINTGGHEKYYSPAGDTQTLHRVPAHMCIS